MAKITPEQLNQSAFELIGKDWMLITAQNADGKINTMTASWGGLGVMWGKNVAFIVIRPQRYTKEFVDSSETFSLTFFDESYKKQLTYLGTTSGRDENKIEKANLTAAYENETPYFKEAKLTIICKKLYAQQYEKDCFIDKELSAKWYPESDYHILYIAEVLTILTA